MTTMALSSFPAIAGNRFLALVWQGFVWAIVRALTAPVTAALIIAMSLGFVAATTNALYMQKGQHPAPFFAERALTTSSVPDVTPVPAVASLPKIITPAPSPVAVVPIAIAPKPATPPDIQDITNEDVKALQIKLTSFGYYEGVADGFYGPRTAAAIRAFETAHGMAPKGAVTRDILIAVAGAKVAAKPAPTPTAAPRAPVVSESVPTPAVTVTQPESAPAERGPKAADPLAQIVNRVATAAKQSVSPSNPVDRARVVESAQRGLASLGFLRGKIDGVAGEATAKAIRNFEVYHNYDVTGAVTPELMDMLAQAGARF